MSNIALCLPLLGGLSIQPGEPFLGHPRGDLQAEAGGVRRVVAYAPVRGERRICMAYPGLHGISTPAAARPVVAYGPIRSRRRRLMGFPKAQEVVEDARVLLDDSQIVAEVEVERVARHSLQGERLVLVLRGEPQREMGSAGEHHAPRALGVPDLFEEAPLDEAADRAPGV